MSHIITAPLVGMHFRPPAKAVLSALPSGTELILSPEPDNEYDTDALRVLVEPDQVPESQRGPLALACEGFGFAIDEVLAAPIFLGFIAKTRPEKNIPVGNKQFLDAMAGSPHHKATLGFSAEGKPQVHLLCGE